jgi:hypothetical protein
MVSTDTEVVPFINSITIRARAAFHLAVAESLWGLLDEHPWQEERNVARKGLDLCWDWVCGETIDQYELYDCHAGEDSMGAAASATSDPDESKMPAWNTADDAICYVIWKDMLIKEECLPADIENATEENILESLTFAHRVPGFDENDFEPLKQYLLETYPASETDEIGPPISKDEILRWVIVQNLS